MSDAEPDPTDWPSDEAYARWADTYGTTGVKNHVLEHPANQGTVAVYREISMAERQLLGRLQDIDAENPGAFDVQRMIVSMCLLHPTVESYPHPAYAVMELFGRVRQHGHGPIEDNEEMVTEDEQMGALPRHVVDDLKAARKTAYDVFHSNTVSSVYKHVIIELASDSEGQLDPQTFDYLWGLSPGKLRDIAAGIEQAHAEIRKQAMKEIQHSDEDQEVKQEQAKRVESNFASPFEPLDRVVGDEAIPSDDPDETEEEAPDEPERTQEPTDEELPPNRPPTKEEIIEMVEG